LGTTNELFGPQSEEDQEPMNESQRKLMEGDTEGLPPGEIIAHPIFNEAFKKYMDNPDGYLEHLDEQILAYEQAVPESVEELEKLEQGRDLLLKVKEEFPKILEAKKAEEEQFNKKYAEAFKRAKELSESTGDLSGWDRVLQLKGAIPPTPEVPEAEKAHTAKVLSALEKAKKTNDFSYLWRLLKF